MHTKIDGWELMHTKIDGKVQKKSPFSRLNDK